MPELRQDDAGSADLDLRQFYPVFFEEAADNLDQLEQILLHLDLSAASDEDLNCIFRCAHSIKGGAATFGFDDVSELTHCMESLLDGLRRREIAPVPAMVDALLEGADTCRSLLARHQNGETLQAPSTAALRQRIEAFALREAAVAAPDAAAAPTPAPPPLAEGERALHITIAPLPGPETARAIEALFRDIPGLGRIEPLAAPPQSCRYVVVTSASDDELRELFSFHVAKEQVEIAPPGDGVHAQETSTASAEASAHDDATPRPGSAPAALAPQPHQAPLESTTIRVPVAKVDQLLNLVGELVITQAMLAQNSQLLDSALHQQLLAGLGDLARHTRGLQEAVMSIRMLPMSTVFSRFPRVLRDLAGKLGKQVELVTLGEATELDKGLVEKITDPLTHLVRNSVDHGIETPEERVAAGKSARGTLTLSAAHQGGSIVIEVRDDGRGMNREKILAKARERGMDVPDAMPDQDVWQLILAPGFSTAEAVTDVSGRGVGMDVVKRNISELGGTLEIDSTPGAGMRVAVRLPLTLAIMDGISVRVGAEVYILPLSSVVESAQIRSADINTVAHGVQLVKVRDAYMPVIALETLFQVPRHQAPEGGDDALGDDGAQGAQPRGSIMVVIEADGSHVALLVDELLGQHQVVVKNLETNYRKVPNVSGATILGDGTVALIVDTAALVRRARY